MVQLTKTLLISIIKEYEAQTLGYESWVDIYFANRRSKEEDEFINMVMPWGKYKGQLLADIYNSDPRYLRLIYQNKEIFDGTKFEDLEKAIQILIKKD